MNLGNMLMTILFRRSPLIRCRKFSVGVLMSEPGFDLVGNIKVQETLLAKIKCIKTSKGLHELWNHQVSIYLDEAVVTAMHLMCAIKILQSIQGRPHLYTNIF